MDFSYLANILLRRKWLLLSVILVSSAATWFFVGKLPPAFKAKTVISTGIIDYKGVSLQKDNPFIQQFQIESSFNGLIEKMKSRNSVKMLTDKLLQHDLNAVNKPFRLPDAEKAGLTQSEFDNLALKLKVNQLGNDSLAQPLADYDNKLPEAYKYDYESLLKKLEIKRIGETDYLSVEFESENPELSFFAVNAFINAFFEQHEKDLSQEEVTSVAFHSRQVNEKKKELDAKIDEINKYKRANGLVDVTTQRESVIGHLKDLELKREEASQEMEALQRAIPILEAKIQEYTKYMGDDYASNLYLSEDYQGLSRQIQELQDKQIELVAAGNKKSAAAMEGKILGLQEQVRKLIGGEGRKVNTDAKRTINEQVRDWIMERIEKKIDLEFAAASERSYATEIARQQGRAAKLLTDDNHLNTLLADQDRLTNEYLRATADLDEAELFAEGSDNPLAVTEPAEMPEKPEPSHRTVFAAFAGVASGTLTSILLFLLAFIDSSLQSPSQFQRVTKLPLLGYANRVKVKKMNLQTLFTQTQKQGELEHFKENIRKLRTALENSGGKNFLFVSPKASEGKSFLIVLLAYALSLNNKRILIIDTNFKNNTLSNFKTKSTIEISTDAPVSGYLGGLSTGRKELPAAEPGIADPYLKNIDIIGNQGGSQSPSEVLAGKDFKKVIEQYGRKYDFIFLEAAAMNDFADARELMPYAEKVVAIFSALSPIGSADKDTIEFLQRMNGKMLGGILNNVDLKNL